MEGVTLLESGAKRAHFALVKRIERASSLQVGGTSVVDGSKTHRGCGMVAGRRDCPRDSRDGKTYFDVQPGDGDGMWEYGWLIRAKH